MLRAKIFFLILFLLPCLIFAYDYDEAETRFNIGAGLELTVNASQKLAGGAAINFNFSFGSSLATGITLTGYTSFSGRYMLEPVVMLRWYFLKDRGHTSWFLQADIGAYINFENDEITSFFSGGLRVGIRVPLGNVFLLEPYARAGYPYMLCVGLTTGFRF